jgi:hypothetical protein
VPKAQLRHEGRAGRELRDEGRDTRFKSFIAFKENSSITRSEKKLPLTIYCRGQYMLSS